MTMDTLNSLIDASIRGTLLGISKSKLSKPCPFELDLRYLLVAVTALRTNLKFPDVLFYHVFVLLFQSTFALKQNKLQITDIPYLQLIYPNSYSIVRLNLRWSYLRS